MPLPLASITVCALVAGAARVTVHVADPGTLTVAGPQFKLEICAVAKTVTNVFTGAPPADAETVASCWVVAVPAVAWKVVEAAPLETTTVAGTVRAPLLLDRFTVREPDAELVKLTVQIAEPPAESVFGEQLIPLS